MLRAGAQAVGVEIDLRAVGNREIQPGRDDAAALLRFTDALVGRTDELDETRLALIDVLGREAVALAAAAAGNFEMMNRVVDGTGIVIRPSMKEIASEIGVDLS